MDETIALPIISIQPSLRSNPQGSCTINVYRPYGIVCQTVGIAGVVVVVGPATGPSIPAIKPAERAYPEYSLLVSVQGGHQFAAQAIWIIGYVPIVAKPVHPPGYPADTPSDAMSYPQHPRSILEDGEDQVPTQAVWVAGVGQIACKMLPLSIISIQPTLVCT